MPTNNTIILTRKIQVFVDCVDKEEKREYYKTIYLWQNLCFRGANYIFTHQFVQDQIKEFLYLKDEVKVKLANYSVVKEGILTTSRMNTTYRYLSHKYKGIIATGHERYIENVLFQFEDREK